MNIENLKLDKWYKVVVYLGVLIILASFLFKIEFLKENTFLVLVLV